MCFCTRISLFKMYKIKFIQQFENFRKRFILWNRNLQQLHFSLQNEKILKKAKLPIVSSQLLLGWRNLHTFIFRQETMKSEVKRFKNTSLDLKTKKRKNLFFYTEETIFRSYFLKMHAQTHFCDIIVSMGNFSIKVFFAFCFLLLFLHLI